MKNQRKDRLFRRISVSFILLISVAFALILTITAYSTFRILNQEYSLRLTQQLGGTADLLDQTINDVYKIHESVQNDGRLKENIRRWYETGGETITENPGDPGAEPAFARDDLMRIRSLSTLLSCVYLYGTEGRLISSYDNIPRGDAFSGELGEIVKAFAASRAYRKFAVLNDSVFYLCALYDSNYRYKAYLAIEMNQNRLFFRCFQDARNMFSDLLITDGEYWIAELGNVLENVPGMVADTDITHQGGRSYLRFESSSKVYSSWTLVGIYDRSILVQDIMERIYPLILIYLVTVAAVILISLLNARRITRPIEELSLSMQQVEKGEYPPPLPAEQDEVGTLIEGFNHMVSSLRQLHQNLLEEQNEKRKIEVASLNTRLQLLQSQINPHFIYNTLNTMNYLASEAGNEELSQIIFSFSSLLRSSVSVDSEYVPLRTEIESVKYYMQIQAYRYADVRFTCEYVIDPRTENLWIPRMILQPLVENSLMHGILPSDSGEGTIRIRCSRREDYLYIHISDNGVGIPPDKLEKLQNGELKVSNGYNHIGLNNVRERINILYQQDCHFQMISMEGEGTVISFRIPIKEGGRDGG